LTSADSAPIRLTASASCSGFHAGAGYKRKYVSKGLQRKNIYIEVYAAKKRSIYKLIYVKEIK